MAPGGDGLGQARTGAATRRAHLAVFALLVVHRAAIDRTRPSRPPSRAMAGTVQKTPRVSVHTRARGRNCPLAEPVSMAGLIDPAADLGRRHRGRTAETGDTHCRQRRETKHGRTRLRATTSSAPPHLNQHFQGVLDRSRLALVAGHLVVSLSGIATWKKSEFGPPPQLIEPSRGLLPKEKERCTSSRS